MDSADATRLAQAVAASLDLEGGTRELPRLAYKSRTQFYRTFRALIEETPGEMRRRLLLERAGWRLSRTAASITEIALDADYGSLEAFTRAFRRAFGASPSIYRRMGEPYYHLPAPNSIHFGAAVESTKAATMDLYDLLAGHDTWHMEQLLQAARSLSNKQLDSPLKNPVKVVPWDTPDQTLREILDRIVRTKEVWTAALTGGALPDITPAATAGQAPEIMLERLRKRTPNFRKSYAAYAIVGRGPTPSSISPVSPRKPSPLWNVRARYHVQFVPPPPGAGRLAKLGRADYEFRLPDGLRARVRRGRCC